VLTTKGIFQWSYDKIIIQTEKKMEIHKYLNMVSQIEAQGIKDEIARDQ